MKKIIAAVLTVAMMSSSVAFAADSANHSSLSNVKSVNHSTLTAFENVKTTSVSTDEMNKVSGEIAPIVVTISAALIGRYIAGKLVNKTLCGSWTCKAR